MTQRNPSAVFASSALDAVASSVEYIEADVTVTGQLAPNDAAFTVPSQVYGQKIVEAPRGWDLSIGAETTILAILDSGINPDHPEFAGRVLAGYDFINDDEAPLDDHGHGTHVAGIAAAALNNAQGSAGICPQCTILPVKVLDSGNKGTWGTVAAGIYYAVDHGARVINLSLGATVSSRTLEDAIGYAEAHDVLVVASAGNAASATPYYPAALPYVIAVGATNDSDVHWPLSNTGDHIDLTAPGHRIYSTYYNLEQNAGYTIMSGTSMASPFVTGLVGLLASFNPELTGTQIVDLMTGAADDLGETGKDAVYGYGRINIYRTLVAANGGLEPSAPPTGDKPEEPAPDEQQMLYLPLVNQG
ncbi:S8 family peptidase [Caldilinea sp.]|uniref:S8 family peptidase n=1 Tax=Caldilinea sp. TaxID=2293560 RepID=UPI002BBA5AC1|nr:peptidase S8 [Anaerolineales bacterium]HQY90362.1 S8 family peptidase [Caldilinea sp.]